MKRKQNLIMFPFLIVRCIQSFMIVLYLIPLFIIWLMGGYKPFSTFFDTLDIMVYQKLK